MEPVAEATGGMADPALLVDLAIAAMEPVAEATGGAQVVTINT